MFKRKNSMNKKKRGFTYIIIGCIVGISVLAITLAVSSLIITKSNIDLSNLKYLCLLSLILAAISSSVFSAYKIRSMKGFVTGLLSSLIVSLLFLLSAIIINGGSVSTFTLLMTIAAVIAGLPGGIIGANLKQ